MNCKDIENNIIDYVDGQLSAEEAKKAEEHMTSCAHCKSIYDETMTLMGVFENEEVYIPSNNLRSNFLKTLEEEKQMESGKLISMNQDSGLRWKRAFQIAASFLLLFLGYFAGTYTSGQKSSQEIATLQEETLELKENMMLAMLENRSASKRIQAVNFSEELIQPDTKILEALIDRMQFDSNINVRLAAAEALSDFSDLEIIKKAFINALSTEKDPNLQIAIIQFLVKNQEKRALAPMQKLLEQPDIPDYVKAQANNGISQII